MNRGLTNPFKPSIEVIPVAVTVEEEGKVDEVGVDMINSLGKSGETGLAGSGGRSVVTPVAIDNRRKLARKLIKD